MINQFPLIAVLMTTLIIPSFEAAATEQSSATDSWTPDSMSDLKRTVINYANENHYPVIGIFLRPDHFDEDIGIASALFLDNSSRQKKKGIYVAMLSPIEVDVIIVDTDRVYFRDQSLKDRQKYRNLKKTYSIDCANSQIGIGNVEYYSHPLKGVKIKSLLPTHVDDIQRGIPKPGTISEYVMKAVCNGKVIYQPK